MMPDPMFIQKCDKAFPPRTGKVYVDCIGFRAAILMLAEELVHEEREACAKLADDYEGELDETWAEASCKIADRIRARK